MVAHQEEPNDISVAIILGIHTFIYDNFMVFDVKKILRAQKLKISNLRFCHTVALTKVADKDAEVYFAG